MAGMPRANRSLTRPFSVVGLLVLVPAAACENGPVDIGSPLLQTEQEAYELRPAGKGFATEIAYEFENRTGGRVYLVNCLGGFGLALDRWEGGEWVRAWSPVLRSCLSPAIVIEDGEVFSDTLHVWGALPGTNAGPAFDTADPSGAYRIRWIEAYPSDRDDLGSAHPIPEEYRVSNSFQLTVP